MQYFFTEFLFCFCLAFIVALVSCVYVLILAHEDILNWWFRFGCRFDGYWFYKIVWGCEKCFAGQLALWAYFKVHIIINISHFKPVISFSGYNILFHIFTVCTSILIARIGALLIERYRL